MFNMLSTIVPKSDQANFDDFVGGVTKTIKVTKVSLAMGEQPVSIHYEGDNGKPYKPGKSMRRVLVHCWGADANLYVGRSMTLYGDPSVVFGGQKVGGIRISHLSDIKSEITMALTTTKAQRKPFTVKPLMGAAALPNAPDKYATDAAPAISADDFIYDIQCVPTLEGLAFKWKEAQRLFKDSTRFADIHAAKEKRKLELTPTEGKTDANTQ